MRFLSVCSGIEAASVAWRPFGWEAVAFSEIEPFPCAVLAHHYPNVPNWGDMTKFQEWPDVAVDLLCGGTPCQSFSVAGLRKGLADPRGNLMLTFGAIAAKYRPRWLVWENVPGVLSNNGGRDFGTFLGMLGQLGYGFAYRVLDAQYVRVESHPRAVPQRRRRVFVVGYLGDWRRAAAVLFERESLSGHPAPSRKAGQGVARPIASCAPGGSGYRNDADTADNLIPATSMTLAAARGAACANAADLETYVPVSMCLNAKGGGGRLDAESETLIPTNGGVFDVAPTLTRDYGEQSGQDHANGLMVSHALRGEGFDASEDGTGRGTPLVPVAFDPTQITSKANRSNPQPGDPCHTLAKGQHAPAIAFQERGREDGRSLEVGGEVAYALTAPKDGGRAHERNVLTPSMQVRRLTPVECARLQGFPDHYLDITHRGKPAADGPKYKALGNSWAVPVARWIGERIEAVEAICAEQERKVA